MTFVQFICHITCKHIPTLVGKIAFSNEFVKNIYFTLFSLISIPAPTGQPSLDRAHTNKQRVLFVLPEFNPVYNNMLTQYYPVIIAYVRKVRSGWIAAQKYDIFFSLVRSSSADSIK